MNADSPIELLKEVLEYCPKCQGLYLFNPKTAEFTNARCNSYSCPFCKGRKAKLLETAITKYLEQFKHIRLFTFTVSTRAFKDSEDALSRISEIWRRFLNNLRRCTALTQSQRGVQFIKVLELTHKGFPHFHVFITEYLRWEIIQELWVNAIKVVTGVSFKCGHVNIEHSYTAERASRYVVKYVLKTVAEKRLTLRVWSKSGNVAIFEKKVSSGEWHFINGRKGHLNLSILSITSPKGKLAEKISAEFQKVQARTSTQPQPLFDEIAKVDKFSGYEALLE